MRWRGNVWGLFLVVFGGWWLLGELGFAPFEWGLIAPLAIVMVGLSMLLGWSACDHHGGWRDEDPQR